MDNPDCYDTSIYNSSSKIGPDADIAGVGVISAFVIAAGLTLIAAFVYSILDNLHPRPDRWCETIEQLIHGLSDQQLVTGLAVLIAGFVRWNTILIYHFEIVTGLGFISSNTHLATLAALRKPLRERKNRFIRAWRVIAMLVLFVLLFVANAYRGYRYWDSSIAWPIRCAAADMRYDLEANYGGEPAKYMGVWAAFLVVEYPIAIAGLFEQVCSSTREHIQNGLRDCNTNIHDLQQEIKALNFPFAVYARLSYWYIRKFIYIVLKMCHSTPFFIIQDTAWYLYNCTTLFQWRIDARSSLEDPAAEGRADGFGQILPLIMLLVPVMAFSEEYISAGDKVNI